MSGRTDAGVHAEYQVCHYDADIAVPINKCVIALNSLLPSDVRIVDATIVEDSFHARYSATSRRYYYAFTPDEIPLFLSSYLVKAEVAPSETLIKQIQEILIGEHDFKHFRHIGSNKNYTTRTIYEFQIKKRVIRPLFNLKKITVFEVYIEANSFLYRMVRNIIGALFHVMKGKQSLKAFEDMLACKATYSYLPANPSSLSLIEVKY